MELLPSTEEVNRIRVSNLRRLISPIIDGGQINIPRQGGGVRVAVFPFDPENPVASLEKTIALRRQREASPMPFDSPE